MQPARLPRWAAAAVLAALCALFAFRTTAPPDALSLVGTDFSYAGFDRGERGVPDAAAVVAGRPVFRAADFGAVADDDRSDEAAIRAAVAAAERAGGGVVELPAGRLLVWTVRGASRPIRVNGSNIVVRGAGAGAGGTVVRIVHAGPREPFPMPKAAADFNAIPAVFVFGPGPAEPAALTGLAVRARRGGFAVHVLDAGAFRRGDVIRIKANARGAMRDTLLAGLEPDPAWTRVAGGEAFVEERHRVAEVRRTSDSSGRPHWELLLHEPVLVDFDAGASVCRMADVLENVGIEDIAFHGAMRTAFAHHRSILDDEGWDAVAFDEVAGCFARRLVFASCNTALVFRRALGCTASHLRFVGNPSHFNAAVRSSSFTLLALSDDETPGGQLHAASVGNSACGTVAWRWSLAPSQAFDFHGNLPYATLVDAAAGGSVAASFGPERAYPHHAFGLVHWNTLHRDQTPEGEVDFWGPRRANLPRIARPLFVGLHGDPLAVDPRTVLANVNPGRPVRPESLYEHQLARRLGSVPAWIAAARAEHARFVGMPLAPHDAKSALVEERFALWELLEDLSGVMAAQHRGWADRVRVVPEGPRGRPNATAADPWGGVALRTDYVLLRALLHGMCTWSGKIPSRGQPWPPAPPCTLFVRADGGRVAFRVKRGHKGTGVGWKVEAMGRVVRAMEEMAQAVGGRWLVEERKRGGVHGRLELV
ncbi:hypothetical protein DFJ74DRAFT_765291 [Hyaloraphidium curvatum]|nr:hypothetical protein DFJ74DRAFT_765291 [Hyaloraphidium curvatum]